MIELMIVVSIIGVFAAIAIPAYQRYIIRAQISEGLAIASGAKAAVRDYYMNYAWPSDNDEAGLADEDDIEGRCSEEIEVASPVIIGPVAILGFLDT